MPDYLYGCHTPEHDPRDVACGYEHHGTDVHCADCSRSGWQQRHAMIRTAIEDVQRTWYARWHSSQNAESHPTESSA